MDRLTADDLDGVTLDDVARFCASPSALAYADVCAEFGIDPGRDVPDDFLAWQMRLGLAARRWNRPQQEPEPKDLGDEVRDKVAKAKRDADAFEKEMRAAL